MSGLLARHEQTPPGPTFHILAPAYVSQQASGFDVTIVRDDPGGQPGPSASPLTINFSTAVIPNSSAPSSPPPASAAAAFTHVNESITFPAGVSTETVHIQVNPDAPNPGEIPIALNVTSAGTGVSGNVKLVSGPDVPPTAPMIESAHLVFRGQRATGIAIHFSAPMAPGPVQNVLAYSVLTYQMKTFPDNFGLTRSKVPVDVAVPLRAAKYDAATDTVTLIPRGPLQASALYTVRSGPSRAAATTLTDLQGTTLASTSDLEAISGPRSIIGAMFTVPGRGGMPPGAFSFTVKGHESPSWAVPPPNVPGGS